MNTRTKSWLFIRKAVEDNHKLEALGKNFSGCWPQTGQQCSS